MLSLIILALLLAGILAGRFLLPKRYNKQASIALQMLQKVETCVLLFFLGVWLGDNETFWSNIPVFGVKGLVFAGMTIAFSIAAVWLAARFLTVHNTKH